MPRPRVPLAKAKLTGAVLKNPGRFADRSDPTLSGRGIGLAPAHLPVAAKAAWRTFCDELPWLCFEDRAALEVAAVLRSRIADDPDAATAALFAVYRGALSSLGATPTDRSRIAAALPADDGDDPYAFLMT